MQAVSKLSELTCTSRFLNRNRQFDTYKIRKNFPTFPSFTFNKKLIIWGRTNIEIILYLTKGSLGYTKCDYLVPK